MTKRFPLAYFLLLLLLAGATTIHHGISSPRLEMEEQSDRQGLEPFEANQRLVFLLQYIATDYDRAVLNGQIADSLEYREMQRFAQQVTATYHSTAAVQQQTSERVHRLERLIADKAALSAIRKIGAELVARLIKEKNLFVFPQRAPDLADGKNLFRENCVSCHGPAGTGDGPAADTLNPKPRDFTAPERMDVCTPLQFYQALTFGVEGTAMPAFVEAFTPEQRWNLAFYLMTLRRDFQPDTLAAARPLSLRQLATKNNLELAAILSYQNRLQRPDSSSPLTPLVDYCRQNPPELAMEEHLAIAETRLKQSLAAHQRADSAAAIELAEEAYWLGFEPIERRLLSRVYLKFERTHTEYHWCLEEKGSPEEARALAEVMLKILQEIRQQKGLRPS
jgi:high-affinity iron transporter